MSVSRGEMTRPAPDRHPAMPDGKSEMKRPAEAGLFSQGLESLIFFLLCRKHLRHELAGCPIARRGLAEPPSICHRGQAGRP